MKKVCYKIVFIGKNGKEVILNIKDTFNEAIEEKKQLLKSNGIKTHVGQIII